MKMKKIPMRSCVVTREKLKKEELIRIVRTKELEVKVDLSGKLNGKGAYLKRDLDVIKKAQKNKVLNRVLEVDIPDSIFMELEKIVSSN